jgi:hypothetical protein
VGVRESIEECTYQMQATTDWSKSVRVEVRGGDVVGHAGNVLPRMLADNLGLTSGLSAALSRPEVTHDRGAVLRDVAVSIAGGAENLAGTAVLRDQERLFGQVASVPTMWRSLNEIDHQGMARIALVRNRVRERVWELIKARHGAIPASRTCYGDLGPVVVIRIDAATSSTLRGISRVAMGFTRCWRGATTPVSCWR